MSFCPSCGAETPPGGRFCPGCGERLSDLTSAKTETSLPRSGESPEAAQAESPPRARRAQSPPHAREAHSPPRGRQADLPPHAREAEVPARAHEKSPPLRATTLDTDAALRFLPGTVLARRYRIIGLAGRGGMGEVYRADDLKLGQPVALKFLPEDLERDRGRLERFLSEVKLARQISHPNVCRVWDVGEVDGHHFISMEFVDGENLASLLRQIGRLPRDKAVQLARQLCAGLTAAHDEGILHRDLKPSNVMIDGRGRARITDFGLAELAVDARVATARAGTPAYMAPEQLSGGKASVASDIYALGIVLYELFTGRHPFEARTPVELLHKQMESSPTTPSSIVGGLDPAVESVILRCLDKEPEERPRSALAVAAALPGGDPLAAALAAGETPSPEMVAAAGPRGGLTPRAATFCVVVVLAGMAVGTWLFGPLFVLSKLPFEKSFEALKENARSIAADLGYEEKPADSFATFEQDMREFMHLAARKEGEPSFESLETPGQRLVSLLYRQGERSLIPYSLGGFVTFNDPPRAPGDLILRVDLAGRLRYLEHTSAYAEPPVHSDNEAPGEADWATLFSAAGLDLELFVETPPTLQPSVFIDMRKAWLGVLPDANDRPVRIEAASLRGKPVFFHQVVSSRPYWEVEEQRESEESGTQGWEIAFGVFILSLLGLVVCGALFLVWRNLKLGRGDRSGALRLAVLVSSLRLANWLLSGHHVADFEGEVYLLTVAVSGAVALGLVIWILYLALEPYVRRLWPQSLVGWNRLLAGRFRDPLIGRDVLLGLTVWSAFGLLFIPFLRLARWYDLFPLIPELPVDALRGGRFAIGLFASCMLTGLIFGFLIALLFLLMKIILRKTWIAVSAFAIVYAVWSMLQFTILAAGNPSASSLAIAAGLGIVNMLYLVFILTRFGLLSLIAAYIASMIGNSFPATYDVSAPYFSSGLLSTAFFLIVVLAAARIALAGRPLFTEGQEPRHAAALHP